MTQCSSQKLAISRVENSAARARAAADGGAFFVQDIDQALRQRHQTRAGGGLKQRRDEVGIVGEVPGAVADHARERKSQQVASRFGIDQQANVLAAEAHGPFIDAGVFIVQDASFRQIAGITSAIGGGSIERAIVAVRFARRDGERNDDAVAGGREQIGDGRAAAGSSSLSGMLKGRPSGKTPRAWISETTPFCAASASSSIPASP